MYNEDAYPVVCLVVENHEGEFLNKNNEWKKIPTHEAQLFPGKLHEVKAEMNARSINDFFVNWVILFGGDVSLEEKVRVTDLGFHRVQQ